MLRRTETRRMASTRGDVCREGETVSSLSEISASWSWYLGGYNRILIHAGLLDCSPL